MYILFINIFEVCFAFNWCDMYVCTHGKINFIILFYRISSNGSNFERAVSAGVNRQKSVTYIGHWSWGHGLYNLQSILS